MQILHLLYFGLLISQNDLVVFQLLFAQKNIILQHQSVVYQGLELILLQLLFLLSSQHLLVFLQLPDELIELTFREILGGLLAEVLIEHSNCIIMLTKR